MKSPSASTMSSRSSTWWPASTPSRGPRAACLSNALRWAARGCTGERSPIRSRRAATGPPARRRGRPALGASCGRVVEGARCPQVDLRPGKPQVVRSDPNAKGRLPAGRPQPEEGRMAYPFKLPELPYPYDALEPHIDARTMEIHRSEEHTSELQSRENLVCRLLLEKKKQ